MFSDFANITELENNKNRPDNYRDDFYFALLRASD